MGPNPDRAPTRTGPQPGLMADFSLEAGLIFKFLNLTGQLLIITFRTKVITLKKQPEHPYYPYILKSGLGPGPGWGPYGPDFA